MRRGRSRSRARPGRRRAGGARSQSARAARSRSRVRLGGGRRGRRRARRGRGRSVPRLSYNISTGRNRSQKRMTDLIPTEGFTTRNGLMVSAGNEHERTCRVQGLHNGVTAEDLKEIFGSYGIIIHAYVSNKPDGTPSGIGKVCFAKPASAVQAARELQGATIDSVTINVTYLGDNPGRFRTRNPPPRNVRATRSRSRPAKPMGLAGDFDMDYDNPDDDVYNNAPSYKMPRNAGRVPPISPENPLSR